MRTRYAANERAAGLGQDTCGDQASDGAVYRTLLPADSLGLATGACIFKLATVVMEPSAGR